MAVSVHAALLYIYYTSMGCVIQYTSDARKGFGKTERDDEIYSLI